MSEYFDNHSVLCQYCTLLKISPPPFKQICYGNYILVADQCCSNVATQLQDIWNMISSARLGQ